MALAKQTDDKLNAINDVIFAASKLQKSFLFFIPRKSSEKKT
jgi:hypothetical protein